MSSSDSPPWGTPDPDEQVLWAFSQQDYRFCIERIGAEFSAAGSSDYWKLQLMLISLQRSGYSQAAAELGASALSGYTGHPWAAACLRLTLGEGTVGAALAAAANDVERWRAWFWEWSRALTTWRRQLAWRARRECDALSPPSAPLPVREGPVLEVEAGQLSAASSRSGVLTAAGVTLINPKREMRVFVSSTFRDLTVEREALAARVFPEVRARCKERAVLFADVDLRWGVTDSQAAEGEVLPLCLAAIDQCRPYFIGILGGRYGWRLQDFAPPILARQPWLEKCAGCSVTEIEFRHGVLNNPGAATAAFYLLSATPAESGEPAERLLQLRARLLDSGLSVRKIDSVDTLVDAVRKDLLEWLDRDFPSDKSPSPLELEAAHHEALALRRAETYIGRWELLASLDDWALSGGEPVFVAGGGRGVTSFLAEWGRRWRRAHPGDAVVLHFVNASDDAGVWPKLVARLIGELANQGGLTVAMPELPMALPSLLTDVARRVAETRTVVIVLDGLHELDPAFGGPELDWLPLEWPSGVRLVLSSSSMAQIEKLQFVATSVIEVPPLERDERALLVRDLLLRFSKALDDDRIERLAGIEAGATPVFLRVLLDELRLAESHEALPAEIDRLAAVPDLVSLLGCWLERLEQRHGAALVGAAMRLLWASRRGRSEDELRAALGDPLAQRLWLPLAMDMDGLLRGPQGRLWLPFWAVREAVAHRYLPDTKSQREAKLALEHHLRRRPLDALLVRERPDLLREAGDWPALAALLAEPGFFVSAWLADPPQVKRLWTAIEAASTIRRDVSYRPWWEGSVAVPRQALRMLAHFLTESGLFAAAAAALGAAPPDIDDPAQRARDYAERARLAYQQGQPNAALQSWRDEEAIWLAEGDMDAVLRSRSNQALVLKDQGFLDTALAIQKDGEKRWRERGEDASVALSLGNQGVIHMRKGDFKRALACHDEELALYKALGDAEGRRRALTNRALALRGLGHMDESLADASEAVRLAQELGDPADLNAALVNRATILHEAGESAQKLNDADQSLAHYAAAEDAWRAANRLPEALADVFNQAMVLHLTHRPLQAIERYREAEALARTLGQRAEVVRALANRASMLVGPLKDARAALGPIEEAARLVEPEDAAGLRDAVAGLLASIRRQTS